MRLIDADAIPFRDELKRLSVLDHDKYITAETLEYMLEHAPTVDAVPVRHGKWIEHNDYPAMAYLCSECGFFTTMPTYHYCPNCGAKMDGAERKEE